MTTGKMPPIGGFFIGVYRLKRLDEPGERFEKQLAAHLKKLLKRRLAQSLRFSDDWFFHFWEGKARPLYFSSDQT